jgi:putative transposase
VADISTRKNGNVRIGGFDFGLTHFLTDQTGKRHSNPQFLNADLKKIARLNRELSRQQKGSNGYKKAKLALAKAHQTIANKRTDWQWKKAHSFATQYDALFFEDLNISAMKKLWGRKVSDLGFSDFIAIQKQVCQKTGKIFGQTGRWQPTTKPCCRCGATHHFDLSVRTFHCSSGDLIIDRDRNAGINIAVAGASATGLGDVRRKLISAIPV